MKMASDRDCHVIFDQANYVTFGTVIKAIDPEVIKKIKSVSSITCKTSQIKKTNEQEVFLGMYISHINYSHTKSVRLTLEEVSVDGSKGSKFYLTLYSHFAEEWINGQSKKMMPKDPKTLIFFRNIPYQKTSSDVQFHLTSAKNSPWIVVKSYFSPMSELPSEKYSYVTLEVASKSLHKKHYIYAVVLSTLKAPVEASNGKGHAMFLLVDPTCYENMIKQREYRVHVFSTTVDAIPKINDGDVVRMHRVVTEIRPNDACMIDFRIFRESDLVVFPWNDSEPPRAANRFTFTENDSENIKRLKAWSLERYRQPVAMAIEPKIITLSEIKPEEVFNLPCRLVELFDEGEGVALWIEDGTRCPLYTCSDSNIQPFDSQATQDICSDCLRICVRCSKRLLAGLKLEPEMLLYLREVHPSAQNIPADDTIVVVQFEIEGAVEILPQNTRYHKSLMQKLNKPQERKSDIQSDPHPNVILSDKQPSPHLNVQVPDDQPELHPNVEHSDDQPEPHLPEKSPEKHLDKETLQPEKGLVMETSCNKNEEHVNVQSGTTSVDATTVKGLEDVGGKVVLGKVIDHIQSSGESSTDRAIREIPSDFFDTSSPPVPELIREDAERETRRLYRLTHPEAEDLECADIHRSQLLSRPSTESQNLASLDDVTFSQVIASTQKPPVFEADASNVDEDETSFSQEITNGQRLFSPGTELEFSGLCISNNNPSDSQKEKATFKLPRQSVSQSRSNSLSPHPKFCAVNEVLEIKTNSSITADCSIIESENQLNTSIDAPLFRTCKTEDDQKIEVDVEVLFHQDQEAELSISSSRIKRNKKHENQVSKKVMLIGDDQLTRREKIVLEMDEGNKTQRNECYAPMISSGTTKNHNEDLNQDSPPNKATHDSIDDSQSCSSVMVISDEISQESDNESVIEIDPLSQDLEEMFCAVERAGPTETYLKNLSENKSIEPGERFRVNGRITGLLPAQTQNELPIDLKNILVAFCFECKHLWQYHHFIDSRSQRVYKSRMPPKVQTECGKKEDDGRASSAVINYLCSEEEHDQVMHLLTESQFPNLEAIEFDDHIFKDYSYSYVCPMCKFRGIPDTLCKLEPTFFFWLHLTQQENESTSCLHVLASGVHAEYFLGTKADHTLRSPVIWKRTEERIAKLMKHQQPITLSLRRNPSPNNEICLEYTYVVYSVFQIPKM